MTTSATRVAARHLADVQPVNHIDHGYEQPLAGGTDVMKRLQDELLIEHGREPREPNPRLASELAQPVTVDHERRETSFGGRSVSMVVFGDDEDRRHIYTRAWTISKDGTHVDMIEDGTRRFYKKGPNTFSNEDFEAAWNHQRLPDQLTHRVLAQRGWLDAGPAAWLR